MPYSSSALTRDASEKRGGGSVKCCAVRIAPSGTLSPILVPLARNACALPQDSSTVTVFMVAGTIWLATARFQTSSYNRRSSSGRYFATDDGVRNAEVG